MREAWLKHFDVFQLWAAPESPAVFTSLGRWQEPILRAVNIIFLVGLPIGIVLAIRRRRLTSLDLIALVVLAGTAGQALAMGYWPANTERIAMPFQPLVALVVIVAFAQALAWLHRRGARQSIDIGDVDTDDDADTEDVDTEDVDTEKVAARATQATTEDAETDCKSVPKSVKSGVT